ncbi:MAG: YfiR family protein [Planctomycetes bacterium]|nr:YfiR family protein [Planctomycetota bacterium]
MNDQSYNIPNRGVVSCSLHAVAVRTRYLIFALFGFSALASQSPANAQSTIDPRREYNVKAVTLYAIGRYVNWPESVFPNEKSPFVIGIFGLNPFGNTLDRIAKKKTIHGRAIVVHQFATMEDYEPCQILFVTRSTPPNDEAQLLENLEGRPILFVGESSGFATRGGTINFFVDGNNVRFELNADQALQSQLVLNAKMHNLGTRVSSIK